VSPTAGLFLFFHVSSRMRIDLKKVGDLGVFFRERTFAGMKS